MKLIRTITKMLEGRKTYAVGLVGLLVSLLASLGVIDLDLTVGEQIQIWLGSFATVTVRAAIAKILGSNGPSF
jgi:hypothetical protein